MIMGAKTRRRFVFESECFYESRTINCTCWKRFRWTMLDDEEYDGDDEREVREIMPTLKLELDEEVGPCEIMQQTQKLELETDERGPHRQDQKLELTPREREKGAMLAYPDPWGPLTTDEEDMEHLLRDVGGLVLCDTEGWGLLPDLWDLNSKAERPASYNYQAEGMDESCDDIFDDNLTWATDLDSTMDFAFDDIDSYINPAVQEEIQDKPDPILLYHSSRV